MKYFDLHCDTMSACAFKNIPLRDNDMHINLIKSGLIDTHAQCYAVFLPDTVHGEEAVKHFNTTADRFVTEMEQNSDVIMACNKAGDLETAEKNGKHAGILTVENALALGGRLDNIEDWKRRGVRMCTLTWNGENELGRGVMSEGTIGLTDFGRQAVKKFEEAGIFVDISHASPEMFWDVVEIAEKPLVASHSNSKALCGHPRNLTDEQFEAIKKSGGVIGLNFFNAFLNDKPEEATMTDILRHAEHFLSLGGEDVVAMGSDMDGAELPSDMKDGLAAVPRMYELFLKHYPQKLVDKMFYDNAADLFKKYELI